MKNSRLASLLCFFSFLSLSLSDLPSSCLSDLISPSAGRCCTPHTFILVEFTLGFGCDVPRYLDGGIRFEVDRDRQDWEPIRFYSPTLDVNEPSLIHFDDASQQSVHAQAFNGNDTFPFHFINASEGPVRIREYLCGEEYAINTVRFRWMQRYVRPSVENVSTWWLDDVKVSRWDGAQLSTIMESSFSNDDLNSYENFSILAGVIETPSCSLSDSVLYFRNESTRSVSRRSLVITRFSLACDGGDCPTPVPRMRDSDCSVTTCGANSIKCSVGAFMDQCSACPNGFSTPKKENSSNPVACGDVDECFLKVHNCSGVAECVNTDGSFSCSCPSGYTLTSEGNSCLDINECNDSSLNNCPQICNNFDGGFNCSCHDGYLLNEDGVLCTVPSVAFDSETSSYTAVEGESITINIVILDNITQPLTITVRTEDISAVSMSGTSSDYIAVNQTITFQPGGNTSLPVTIQTLQDDHAELVESFRVVISQPLLGIEENVTVYIMDSNEVLVEFDPTSYETAEGQDVMFRIIKRTSSSRNVTVIFSTRPATANATSDYKTVSSLSITFLPGEMERVVNVSTLDDVILEGDEILTATLELVEGDGGISLGHFNATATIRDDDAVRVGFRSSVYEVHVVEGEEVVVTIEMKGETAIDVMVNIATQDSTASANEDYTSINETLTFSNTVSIHNVTVPTTNDDTFDGDKLFQLVLSQHGVPNDRVILADNIITNVTILDDDSLTALPPVTLGFEQSTYNISEDAPPFSVYLEVKEGQLEDQITVTVSSRDLDAQAGHDYIWQPSSTQLTLVPGLTVVCLGNVTLINDKISENDSPELFQLSLQAPPTTQRGQSVHISPDTVQVAIYDDDELLSRIEDLEHLSMTDPSEASDQLSNIVDAIIESGRAVPLSVSMEILEASQEFLQNIGTSGDMSDNAVSGRILTTLDRFALNAYDEKTQPELKLKGISLRVQEVTTPPSTSVVGIDQNGTTIELPVEAFTRAGQTVRLASFLFSNLSSALTNQTQDPDVENARIGSPVISTALGCGRRGDKCPDNATNGFSVPVRIVLPLMLQDGMSKYNINCDFLNISNNTWSNEGCFTVNTTDTSVVCECNHLTHFAILLSPNLKVTDANALALQVIGYVGVSISLVCMVITIVALLALKSLWGMRNYIHVNLCVCLIIAQLIFVIGVDKTENQGACSAIAVLLHYWFLAAFMWMLMEGVVLYVALVRVFIKKQRFYIIGFTVVSYGVPLLYMIVTIPLGLVLEDENGGNFYGSSQACWLRYDTHFVWAFIVPVILIILANIGFFIMAICIMYKHQRRSVHKSAVKNVKHWLKTSIALLFIMGITWIIGVLVFHKALLFVAYIFTIFVAFQGAVIFVMFIVLSKQVRENYRKWWRGKVAESDILSKYFSSSESSGKGILGRFTSMRTSSFRLSRNRSTFRSSNIDSEMKIPDEQPDPPRDTLSLEIRMNEYMKKQKLALGDSVAEPSDHVTDEPSSSIKKVTFGDSIAETSEYFPPANGHSNGVAIIITKAKGDHNHIDASHHDPVSANEDTSSSSSKQDLTSVNKKEQDNSLEQRLNSSDTPQQTETDRQITEENTAL